MDNDRRSGAWRCRHRVLGLSGTPGENAVLIQAENNYQRAFHELSYHMDILHDK